MWNRFILLLLFAFISISVCQECGNGDGSAEVRLHKRLLCNYDRDNRPVKNHKSAVNVTVRMLLKFLRYSLPWASIELIQLNNWLSLRWKDEYLTWEPKDYEGVDVTTIHSSKIWIPDLSLYNSPEGQSQRFSYPCQITYDGSVVCIPQVVHTAVCKMNYKSWPFDRQQCNLSFGTWMHKGEEVNFILSKDPVSTADYVESKYWRLISINASKDEGVYKCCPNETYPTLRYKFVIERFSTLIVEQFLTPALAMISMTLVSLCLNIESTEKLIVMLFNLGCHFFYLYCLNMHIPGNGNIIPNAVIYFRDTSILTCIVLFHGVILRNIVKYTKEAPAWVNKLTIIMNSTPGKIVFHEFDPTTDAVPEDIENLAENKSNKNDEWKKIALFFNRSFFVVILLTYIILILAYLF